MTFLHSVGEASVVLVVMSCIVLPESESEYENIAISALLQSRFLEWNGMLQAILMSRCRGSNDWNRIEMVSGSGQTANSEPKSARQCAKSWAVAGRTCDVLAYSF